MEKMLHQNGKKFPTKIICCVKNAQQNIHLFINIITMIAYKFKWITVEDWKLCIKFVQKFVNWKFEKTISPYDALDFADKIVMYEKDFDNIMAHTEYKSRYREREQSLF